MNNPRGRFSILTKSTGATFL